MVMVARNALPLRGAPNGLFYEDLSDTLFIADERDSSIVMIPSGHPPRVVARIPAGCSQRPSIGGLARSPDGTFFVARLGWGEAGAVVRVTDQVTILDGTDPTWWHLGVAYDERNGILWATAFERPAFRGWLMAIDPQSGRVVERVGGFQKPV